MKANKKPKETSRGYFMTDKVFIMENVIIFIDKDMFPLSLLCFSTIWMVSSEHEEYATLSKYYRLAIWTWLVYEIQALI